MKLMTKELEKLFEKYPIGSQDELLGDAKLLVKFFNPTGVGTWLITEGNKLNNGDYELYGYCHLGDDELAEFGSILLSELEELKLPFGLTIERDLYMPKNLNVLEAIRREGFEPPSFLINKEQEEEQEME